jgi:hypothetical protein
MNNLNEIVAHILGTHNNLLQALWLAHSPIKTSEGYPTDLKKINAFLRLQLGLLPVDTYKVRECLTNEPVPSDWIEGFEEEIAPVIAQYGLPCWTQTP